MKKLLIAGLASLMAVNGIQGASQAEQKQEANRQPFDAAMLDRFTAPRFVDAEQTKMKYIPLSYFIGTDAPENLIRLSKHNSSNTFQRGEIVLAPVLYPDGKQKYKWAIVLGQTKIKTYIVQGIKVPLKEFPLSDADWGPKIGDFLPAELGKLNLFSTDQARPFEDVLGG